MNLWEAWQMRSWRLMRELDSRWYISNGEGAMPFSEIAYGRLYDIETLVPL